ncbi:MAG: hypothetical protein QMC59_00130 [Candidatus Poseidoniaceae archaeon]|tara:strand:+ start:1 stop:1971 length:1971 start_codon:yes stop_codon:yes gene_type:complete
MARPRFAQTSTAVTIIILFLLMAASSMVNEHSAISEPSEAPTSARQESLEVDCSGYKFEDLFDYNFAAFDILLNEDWATAQMGAVAYVNGSNSATVRENLDGLFEGTPGGNNSWMSTDEREAIRAIGPDCIADMDTRIGIREGLPHRGGVDWNDLEFVKDGISLDEVNLVPDNHAEERNCQNLLASSDCKEVPVTITDDLQILMFTKEGESNNVQFDQLPNSGASNFTLALNVTNMSQAGLVLTFPQLQGLRLVNSSLRDDGMESTAMPLPETQYLPDGRLRVTQEVNYASSEYPIIRNLFLDFTTQSPETNEVPEWTAEAPVDGTVIPYTMGTRSLVAGVVTELWATDDSGWALDCTFADSDYVGQWITGLDEDGTLFLDGPADVAANAQAESECTVVDPFGATSVETRNWTFAQPFTADAVISEAGDAVEFTLTPTGVVSELSVSAHAHQMATMGQMRTVTVASDASTISLPLEGLAPGMVLVMGQAQSNGMLDYEFMLDFGLKKASAPPVIELEVNLDGTNATWDASYLKFTLQGKVLDADGESVQMSLTLCGYSTNDFVRSGIVWEIDVNIVSCSSQNPPVTIYDITLVATDESGIMTTMQVQVPDPYASSNDPIVDDSLPVAEESMPALSTLATLTVTLLGVIVANRAKKE